MPAEKEGETILTHRIDLTPAGGHGGSATLNSLTVWLPAVSQASHISNLSHWLSVIRR